MGDLTHCRSCNALVRFVQTREKKWIPLDPDPVPNGNIVSGWDCKPRFLVKTQRQCRVCGCTETDACPGVGGIGCSWIEQDLCDRCRGKEPRRYQAHFVSCPQRKQHRRPATARAAADARKRSELAKAQGRLASEGLGGSRR